MPIWFWSKEEILLHQNFASSLWPNKCKALPFFHAFSGCDTDTCFYGHSKTKIWDAWFKSSYTEQLTGIVIELSKPPKEITNTQIDIIKYFIISVYDPSSNTLESIDIKRFNSFTRLSDPSLGTLPPSRKGLTEHTKELSCTRILRYGVGKTTEGGRYYPQWYLKGDTS